MLRPLKFKQVYGGGKGWHHWGYVSYSQEEFTSPLPPNIGGASYQYVGAEDKEGKEIYEGDVVKLGFLVIGVVEFVDSGFWVRQTTGPEGAFEDYMGKKCDWGDMEIVSREL